jgi:hypothetical protein
MIYKCRLRRYDEINNNEKKDFIQLRVLGLEFRVIETENPKLSTVN